MAKVEGIDKVNAALRARYKKAAAETAKEGVVGYTAAYAVYVHEDLEAHHPQGGQAKFLEQPARERRAELAKVVSDAALAGRPVDTAILLACLTLQRYSQLLCPVDTGALRASAFSALEDKK